MLKFNNNFNKPLRENVIESATRVVNNRQYLYKNDILSDFLELTYEECELTGLQSIYKPKTQAEWNKDYLDKMTPELEKDIKEYQVNRSIKQIDLMKKHNISRNTLKKYVKLVDAKNKNKSISSEEAEDYGEISKDNFKLTYTYGDDEYTYTRGFISKSSMEAYIKIGKEKDLRVKRIEEI